MRKIALGVISALALACAGTGEIGDGIDDPSNQEAPANTAVQDDTNSATSALSFGRRRDSGTLVADAAADVRDAAADVRDAAADVRDAAADVATDVRDAATTADAAADVRDAATADTGAVPVVDSGTTTGTTPPPAPAVSGTTVAPAVGQLSVRQVAAIAPAAGLRAFPGAEGFGASATGGRGGRVIYVTTLSPTGPGSLTEALSATGARTILFKVSGVIDGSFRIAQGNVTIAGQSSPGGVVVRGLRTDEANWCDSNCGAGAIGVDNVVIRHLRTRPGESGGLLDGDGLRIRHSRNVVVDHVSSENAIDEAMEISYSNNVTVQDSILAETLGGHADRGGMLMNYSNPAAGYQLDAITVARTAWIRIMGRYPEMSRESAADAGRTARVELANNLIWDQQYFLDSGHTTGVTPWDGSPVYWQVNWVGNMGYARSTYPYGMMWFANPTGRSTVFFSDDHLNMQPSRADWGLNYCCNDFVANPVTVRPTWAVTARHAFPAVTYLASDRVRNYVIAHAGAFPRDPMDRRLMGYVAAGVIPSSVPNANPANDARVTDWGTGAPPAAPTDTDNDGMPDAWESARGTNPAVQDHNGTTVGNATAGLAGYTNLEVYLHQLAQQRLREGRWGV